MSGFQNWQLNALSLDVCKSILDSKLALEMIPEKAKVVTDKVHRSELSKEEQGWIKFEDLTKNPAILWKEQDQTQLLLEKAKAEQLRVFKELQEAYK